MIKTLDRTGTWQTYSMVNGLAGMRIEHIAEDSIGYLWFATWDNGVSRFDGDEFQNFTRQDGLISDRVYFVSEDSQKRLWFGTLNGVCCIEALTAALNSQGSNEFIGQSTALRQFQTRLKEVASTNRNLEEMTSTGALREDLYYRIYGFPLYLPPLRDRKEDIPHLAEFFKDRLAAHIGKDIAPLTTEVIEELRAYDWPGNVRELEHTIQRAVTVCHGSRIALEDLGSYRSRIKSAALDLAWTSLSDFQDREIVSMEEFERLYILEVLEITNWKVKGTKGAAARLELPPSTLYSRMKKLGIERP